MIWLKENIKNLMAANGNGTITLIHLAFGPNLYWQGGTADYNVGANWAGGVGPGAGANTVNDSGQIQCKTVK